MNGKIKQSTCTKRTNSKNKKRSPWIIKGIINYFVIRDKLYKQLLLNLVNDNLNSFQFYPIYIYSSSCFYGKNKFYSEKVKDGNSIIWNIIDSYFNK